MFQWFSSPGDREAAAIIRKAIRRAHKDQPDVRVCPDQVLPEFDEMARLFQGRIVRAQAAAADAIRSAVEFVAANAQLLGLIDPKEAGVSGPAELAESRQARAAAERLDLQAAVLREAQRVCSADTAHRAAVEQLVREAAQRLADLDGAVRAAHRHAEHLTYPAPTSIAIPKGWAQIGLERITPITWLWAAAPSSTEEGEEDDRRFA